ncbi:MAG TPA: polyprenyl synthetase family protein [Nitrososphaeraceae archaeon]|nr:polyprenyl synthetase family protein [Nitrososphaeraceae archaeon]
MHTESVIHDDIIDEENLRRGKPSFHVKYGYNSSQNAAVISILYMKGGLSPSYILFVNNIVMDNRFCMQKFYSTSCKKYIFVNS